MSDFVNDFWSVYIAVLTVAGDRRLRGAADGDEQQAQGAGSEAGAARTCVGRGSRRIQQSAAALVDGVVLLTIVFSVVYLVLYPGFGSLRRRVWLDFERSISTPKRSRPTADTARRSTGILEQGLAVVAADAEARAIGQRLFLNYCAQCHGSDAGGGIGFPSLRDKDWLYGGEPETIKASIMEGRNGVMPALGSVVGGREGATARCNYVLSLSGRPHDTIKAVFGKEKFAVCAGCHGTDGKGSKALGAPNLTDDIWLYGGSQDAIVETILMGRKGLMPAHKDFLGEAKVHVLAAYIYSLSVEPGVDASAEGVRRRKSQLKRNSGNGASMKPADADTALEREFDQHFELPTIRRVSAGRPFAWLALGVRDMRENLVESLSYGTVVAVAGWLIWAYTKDRPQPFTASVTGFFLIAPLLAAGLYEISRRQEQNMHTSFGESLQAWRRSGGALAHFGLALVLVGDLLGALVGHPVCAVVRRRGAGSAKLLPRRLPVGQLPRSRARLPGCRLGVRGDRVCRQRHFDPDAARSQRRHLHRDGDQLPGGHAQHSGDADLGRR